jgi:hypothetical protein
VAEVGPGEGAWDGGRPGLGGRGRGTRAGRGDQDRDLAAELESAGLTRTRQAELESAGLTRTRQAELESAGLTRTRQAELESAGLTRTRQAELRPDGRCSGQAGHLGRDPVGGTGGSLGQQAREADD